ncbi:MAG: hypothetical protein KDK07_01725 [Bauldia sp.]|nr:hypothetical protein [Bauldia sp.]
MARLPIMTLLVAGALALGGFTRALADDEGGSQAQVPAIAFKPIVDAALANVLLPGYEALAASAAEEATRLSDLCLEADDARLAAAREGFRDLVLAWSRIELVRFGPVRDRNRYERVFFWPDPRGRGLQQVQEILATQDPAALAVASLREKSVAVQGLPALEFVLYGTGSEALVYAADPAGRFRCGFGKAIAGAIAATSQEVLSDWTRPDGYADLMRKAGADNPVYRSHGEVVQDLIKAAREQLQLVRDLKIANVIEATPEKAQPKRAPFWRSNLTVPAIRANIDAVLALVGPDGISAALPADAAWIGGEIAFELAQVDGVLARVEDAGPWEDEVRDSDRHKDLTYVLIPLGDIVSLLEDDYPGAFGLIMGFNSLDGD